MYQEIKKVKERGAEESSHGRDPTPEITEDASGRLSENGGRATFLTRSYVNQGNAAFLSKLWTRKLWLFEDSQWALYCQARRRSIRRVILGTCLGRLS